MGRILHDVGVNKAAFLPSDTALTSSAMSAFLALGGTGIYTDNTRALLRFEPHVLVGDRLSRLVPLYTALLKEGLSPDLFVFEIDDSTPLESDLYVLLLDEERRLAILGKYDGEIEEVFAYEVPCSYFR